MSKIDIVRAAFDFSNENSADLLADNFQGTDSVGGPPLDKAAWTGMGQMMRGSFPDMQYVISDIREEGDTVYVTGRFTGTFVNDLDMSMMGMGVIPATGQPIDFQEGEQEVTFEGDLIVRSHDPNTGPDAGLPGFLKAIGAG